MWSPPVKATRATSFKVLLVDDNDINLLVAEQILLQLEVAITTATNGREAADKALSGTFDLVLMDVQMPVMDGVQATGLIRQKYSKQELPIFAFTANVMEDDIKKYCALGMNGHLAKPVDADKLIAIVSSFMDSKENNVSG